MKKILILIGMCILLSNFTSAWSLYENICWDLSHNITCINGTAGYNIWTGVKFNASDIIGFNGSYSVSSGVYTTGGNSSTGDITIDVNTTALKNLRPSQPADAVIWAQVVPPSVDLHTSL